VVFSRDNTPGAEDPNLYPNLHAIIENSLSGGGIVATSTEVLPATIPTFPATSTAIFTFSTPATLSPGNYLFEVVPAFYNAGFPIYHGAFAGTNGSTYPDGTLSTLFSAGGNCPSGSWSDTTKDAWFLIEDNNLTPPTGQISFFKPTNGSTTDDLFGALGVGTWGVNVNINGDNSATSSTFFHLNVQYHKVGSLVMAVDNLDFPVLPGHFPFTSSVFITKKTSLTLGDWTATARLFWNTGTAEAPNYQLLASDTITFTIGLPPPEEFITGPTASSTCANLGWLGEPLCHLAFLLFVPPQATLNKFTTSTDGSDLTSLAKQKAPFSYIFQITDLLNTASTTPATSSFTVAATLATLGGSAGQIIFSAIGTTLAIILWLAFGLYLYQRFKNFEL
jgi:hypothetical protein